MSSQIRLPEQNQVFLVGRLTRDPDVRFTQKGQAVCRIDIAVNRSWKDNVSGEWKKEATFVPIVVWGAAAERCKDKLKKGSPVHVEGRIATDEYTGKDGVKRKSLQIVARRLQFLAAAETTGAGDSSDADTAPAVEPSTAAGAGVSEEVDDVPF